MYGCYGDDDDYFDLIAKRLSPCFCQFATCVPNQVCWKPLNHQLLLHTQSTEIIVRMAAIHCMCQMWDSIGPDIVYLITETLPYLRDLLEDSNQEIIQATREFCEIIQKHLGTESLQSYFN